MEAFSMDQEPSEIQQSIRRGQVKLGFSDMSRVGMPSNMWDSVSQTGERYLHVIIVLYGTHYPKLGIINI